MRKGLLVFLICTSLGSVGQRKMDTVKVFMLVSDTATNFAVGFDVTGKPSGSIPIRHHQVPYYQYGYSVRERHNEAEGEIDPGYYADIVWKDFWVHKLYLNDNKFTLSKNIVVWLSIDINQKAR